MQHHVSGGSLETSHVQYGESPKLTTTSTNGTPVSWSLRKSASYLLGVFISINSNVDYCNYSWFDHWTVSVIPTVSSFAGIEVALHLNKSMQFVFDYDSQKEGMTNLFEITAHNQFVYIR